MPDERHQEHHAVHRKGHAGSSGERAAQSGDPHEGKRHQRGLAAAPLDTKEDRARDRRHDRARQQEYRVLLPLDGGERDAAQRDRARDLARGIEPAALGVGRFRHRPPGESERRRGRQRDEQEDAAPAGAVDHQAADGQAKRERDTVAARPDADGLAPLH